MKITSLPQYNAAWESLVLMSSYLSFRNFSKSEAKKYNDLRDGIENYEKKKNTFH